MAAENVTHVRPEPVSAPPSAKGSKGSQDSQRLSSASTPWGSPSKIDAALKTPEASMRADFIVNALRANINAAEAQRQHADSEKLRAVLAQLAALLL